MFGSGSRPKRRIFFNTTKTLVGIFGKKTSKLFSVLIQMFLRPPSRLFRTFYRQRVDMKFLIKVVLTCRFFLLFKEKFTYSTCLFPELYRGSCGGCNWAGATTPGRGPLLHLPGIQGGATRRTALKYITAKYSSNSVNPKNVAGGVIFQNSFLSSVVKFLADLSFTGRRYWSEHFGPCAWILRWQQQQWY
jgi:hypothetical protein